MGKWVISKPYQKSLDNIQTLPDYRLPIKNWVLPIIFGSNGVRYPLPNGYGHPYLFHLGSHSGQFQSVLVVPVNYGQF